MARIIIAAVRFSLLFAAVMGTSLSAQIATDLVERRKADFHIEVTVVPGATYTMTTASAWFQKYV